MRERLAWIGFYARGMAMGAADVVPGVSGGTMALVLGIYERLVAALRAATSVDAWRALGTQGLATAWRAVDGAFLLPLVAGIATSVLLLAQVVEIALVEHRVLLYAGFTGLVAASIVVLARTVRGPLAPTVLLGAAMAAATFVLLGIAPATTPQTTWFLVASGAVAIAALVLPGVSGAFILVVMGQYETVLGAIGRLDLVVLFPFALGAVIGLTSIVRILDALLRRARALTLAALTGIMIGSLRRLWPWIADAGDPTHDAPQAAVATWPPGALGPEGWIPALVVTLVAAGAVIWLERSGARGVRREPFSSGS